MCAGSGTVNNTYTRISIFGQECPRCHGSGSEPAEPLIHMGLVLRHPRSGKVWAVYGDYPNGVWGVHRMIVSRRTRSHYVWQIILRHETRLLTWPVAGFGDAWDHDLMETDPVESSHVG